MEEYFFKMITHARTEGEVILYENIPDIHPDEVEKTLRFLEDEYNQEKCTYPLLEQSPVFDGEAAIWAARIFYYSSQLLLFREQSNNEVRSLIQPYNKQITPSAILSADLILRFMPDLLSELKLIDDTDVLIDWLENILNTFHYSAVGYHLENEEPLNFDIVDQDMCLKQLYIDRVIDRNHLELSRLPALHDAIEAQLGIYQKELWNKFE